MKNVLILAGLDPTGGAGIGADIETLCAHNIHSLPFITALTAQNTSSVAIIRPVTTKLIKQQIYQLKDDIRIDGIKIGLLGSEAQIKFLINIVIQLNVPVVFDPIIKSSTGDILVTEDILPSIRKLITKCTLITPNAQELLLLSQIENEQQAVKSLNCPWVLLTKTDSADTDICHTLYKNGEQLQKYNYQKLPQQYHGSGCTLSAAIIAGLVQNKKTQIACENALNWTYQTLKTAYKLGKAQLCPNRISI